MSATTHRAAVPALPDDSAERLEYPIATGLLLYFPRACAAVARHSKVSNDQHNPGEPMHWAHDKSIGTGDQCVRHLIGGLAAQSPAGSPAWRDEVHHLAALAWRSLELLERKLAGLPPFGASPGYASGAPARRSRRKLADRV